MVTAPSGACGKCGAPYFVYQGAWHSITPPPIIATCACWNVPKTTTTSTT